MAHDFEEIVPGRVAYVRGLIAPEMSTELRKAIVASSPLIQERLRVAGVSEGVPFPRLVAWHGDPGIPYHYSGISHPPADWTEPLSEVRRIVADLLGPLYPEDVPSASGCGWPNGVLVNLYRDGRDSIGRHADREADLVPGSPIAGVSLGAVRTMRLRPMGGSARDEIRLALEDGSLLLMYGGCQRSWTHEIRKEPDVAEERVSLTFRCVIPPKGAER